MSDSFQWVQNCNTIDPSVGPFMNNIIFCRLEIWAAY